MEITNKEVNLDQPFTADAPAGEQPEKKETEVKTETEPIEPEKPRVPYSRFENVSRARREAEAEAEKWRQRALELEEKRFDAPRQDASVPSWWIQLYGDTEQAKSAFSIWNQAQQAERNQIREEAESRALEAIENRERVSAESERQNLETIDESIENVSSFVGRELTDDEESKLLDIVDELTPKDENGNYMGPLVPFDKAWEVLELRNQVQSSPRRKQRDSIAQAINTPSDGQPSADQVERDKNWRPGAWGQWEQRLQKE